MRSSIKSLILGMVFLFHACSYSQTKNQSLNYSDIVFGIIGSLAVHTGLGIAHQLGHLAAAKLFLECGAQVKTMDKNHIENNRAFSLHINSPFSIDSGYPKFKSKMLNKFVDVSGPLAGFLAAVAVLSASNIIIEFNTNRQIPTAFVQGFQKTVFNEKQPFALKAVAAMHLGLNFLSCMPYFNKTLCSRTLTESKKRLINNKKTSYLI